MATYINKTKEINRKNINILSLCINPKNFKSNGKAKKAEITASNNNFELVIFLKKFIILFTIN